MEDEGGEITIVTTKKTRETKDPDGAKVTDETTVTKVSKRPPPKVKVPVIKHIKPFISSG